jgi:hypothetical protein
MTRRIISLAIIAIGLIMVAYAASQLLASPRNTLAIGPQARVDQVAIALASAQELDGLSREKVLDLRRAAAARYPDLIAGDYVPTPAVFGQIEDGRPWWGMPGQFYHGPGEQSIAGPAEESRFILNPYLLVAAEFSGLSIWSTGRMSLAWDRARITAEQVAQPGFPLTCSPRSLRWWPSAARAAVTYDVSACVAAINQWALVPFETADARFDLIAYNARDMGFDYLYVSFADSPGIGQADPPDAPVAIQHYLHRGSSCGYPGGCNNMSPHTPEIEDLAVRRLPARVTIRLWRTQPADAAQTPDMTFLIDLQ